VIGWTICGLYVVSQLFGDYPRDTKTGMIVYLGFWLYFEYKGIFALLWRKFGNEMIKLDNEYLWLKRDIRSYGKLHRFDLANIKELTLMDYDQRPWVKTYSQSFWVVGGETISFRYLGQPRGFGMQLSKEEGQTLFRKLGQRLRQQRKG
ncbi:MAG: hypothetical protein AAGB22_11740, partial [Bacteroidota bacterium]